MSEEWRDYWTPGECADMRRNMTPEELEEELCTRRRKAASIRAAREMGVNDGEAAVMRVRGTIAMHEARTGEDPGPSAVGEEVDDEPPF